MKEIRETIAREAPTAPVRAFGRVYGAGSPTRVRRWTLGILGLLAAAMLLPWTQSIRADGSVTTLRQEARPQELNSVIGGRIMKWHVAEGDLVEAGDTIAQLSEIKDAYLDPQLLARTQDQLDAKAAALSAYRDKVDATTAQLRALQEGLGLKLEQIENKILQLDRKLVGEEAELRAAKNDLAIATAQLARQRVLRDSGLVSLSQLEQRGAAYQTALAKQTSAEAKYGNTRTDLATARIEASATRQEYLEKRAKAEGERAASMSSIADAEGDFAKLTNQFANYRIRAGMYYLLAPQAGQVARALKAGLGEVVKEGEMLVEIVPRQVEHAVEMFVRPVDLPLVQEGQQVMFQFDGFPALVFSGWPAASSGTFRGAVVSVANSPGADGKFRVLVAEEEKFRPWPRSLRVGTGAASMALCNDVQVWYELWRNVNGFPPDYYKPKDEKETYGKGGGKGNGKG